MPDPLLRSCRGRIALHLAASAWLLASLALSLASAYGGLRMVIVMLIVFPPYRWITLGLWLAVPVLLIVQGARSLLSRRYLAGIGWIAAVALGLLIVWPDALVGERLRFYATKSAYDRAVSEAEAGHCSSEEVSRWSIPAEFVSCGKPVLLIFDWGGLGSIWFGIVYDAADEIAEPVGKRSVSWKAREAAGMLSCSGIGARLGGHYYVAGGSLGEDCG